MRSTPTELQDLRELVKATEKHVLRLRGRGKKIHFIWDVDCVLVSARSHDVYEHSERHAPTFREYESRQFLQVLGNGPWVRFATKCGQLHHSQDIVTARAGFPVIRVLHFCFVRNLEFRDMLFVGGQSKAASYDYILRGFKKDKDWHVFLVDDTESHVRDFEKVAAKLRMKSRTHAIQAPRIRHYEEAELERHFLEVMDPERAHPYCATNGTDDGRCFLVIPNYHDRLVDLLQEERDEAKKEAEDETED